MSDALCGPSNAVRNLTKHSSVDRTLHQDRLLSRQSPSQGFRSVDPNVASLDPEFEAFQNGHGLAGPSWAASSLDTFRSQPPPFPSASPLPSTSWTQDFNRLTISSPQHPQLVQPASQAWHNHFGQHAQEPAPLHAPPARMQMPPASFHPMPSAPRYASQSQTSHQQILSQDHFDEAAFEAAFDAALQDASMDNDSTMQQDEQQDSFHFDSFPPDMYPHLPLFRLALANALITNTDESLHRAAKVVALLIRHPRAMDPVQAMLFRPLLSALNDPKRTLFSQRYSYEPALNVMLDNLAQQTENARLGIDASTEQLLASYADLLWQRTESNHLQANNIPRSADNDYWLENFRREDESTADQNITQHSARLLIESFNRQVISDSHSQALSRVLDMEYKVYSRRPALSNISMQQPTSTQEREAVLFNMMEHILAAPETVEALEAVAPNETEDYETQSHLSGQQQGKGISWLRQMALEQERARNPVMQSLEEPSFMTEDIIKLVEEDALRDEMGEESEQQRREQRELDRQNDDELAQTAANLLERVSDNQTSKFKNSAFFGLMRQLADREVRVEGDKMVLTNTNHTLSGDRSATQDGQELVNLLDQSSVMMDRDPEFMMTSPFASADDY